jgi:hypothetical protein
MTKKKLVKNIVKGTHFVERMECIALIDRSYKWTPDKMLTSILSLVDMEREACAKICESPDIGYKDAHFDMADYLASAIRARGEK